MAGTFSRSSCMWSQHPGISQKQKPGSWRHWYPAAWRQLALRVGSWRSWRSASWCPWLPALTALTRLQLGSLEYALRLPAGFSRLACLGSATIQSSQLSLPADGLPPSLTNLRLVGAAMAELSDVQVG